MCRICPKCGSIAEFSEYYGRVVCTRCEWQSEKLSYNEAEQKYSIFPNKNEETCFVRRDVSKPLVKIG